MTTNTSGPAEGSAAGRNDQELRAEVREWLDANWDGNESLASDWWHDSQEYTEWMTKVVDARWAVPTWPEEWAGRGLSEEQAAVIEEEFERVGAPGARQDKVNMIAATVFLVGSQRLKEDLLLGLLRNQVKFCLLYSEPNAGSDLAAVRTRADRDGDEFVVNGQKVWTSGAKTADVAMLIARTNWDVPKHKGLTFFVFPMKQDGVEVRPIRQINGEQHFNEVFLSNTRVPVDYVIGGIDNGWRALQTALAYERLVLGDSAPLSRRGRGVDDLVALARRRGLLSDPVLRQDLAKVLSYRALNTLNSERAKQILDREDSTPLMSLTKLAMSRVVHEEARVRTDMLGPDSLLAGEEHPEADDTNYLAFNAYFTSFGGGTDQIQRNIIGERVLGLAKEPEVDRDVPFKLVRSS